jgi:molecular chaperone Hsp33
MPADDTETLVSLADRLAAQPALAVKDEMCTALSADGFVSAKAVVSSTLVRELATRQNCLPLAAAALGRAVICTLLMAEGLKQLPGAVSGRRPLERRPCRR